jgi:hypothetical protein
MCRGVIFTDSPEHEDICEINLIPVLNIAISFPRGGSEGGKLK